MKIGIIIGSTRNGRAGRSVGEWVLSKVENKADVQYELVDLKDYDLPFLGTSENQEEVMKWNAKLAELDGFIFITAEYNHSITGALKNALDSAREAWNNKAAGIVSYGSAGGARAAEHLRGILSELQIASVRSHILLSLFDDFEQFSIFKPRDIHDNNLTDLFNQVESWSKALKTIR